MSRVPPDIETYPFDVIVVGMGINGAGIALDTHEAAANIAAKHLGWSEERAKKEVEAYREYVRCYRPKQLRESESTTVR